jgi:dTDP-4-amino-4,6-dideoxygalactose transaminase
LFVILFPNHRKILKNYNKIYKEFYKNNLAVMLHYSPVHLQPFYKKKGFKIGDFPISENYAKRAFSIPNFPNLKIVDQKNVIKKVFKILKKYYYKGK